MGYRDPRDPGDSLADSSNCLAIADVETYLAVVDVMRSLRAPDAGAECH
jgi:hypothetical protein